MNASEHDKDDGPIEEIAKEAQRAVERGAVTFQKFTCGQCGARKTMPDANNFYRRGHCDDCDHVTELTHCGFAAYFVNGDEEIMRVIQTSIRNAPDGKYGGGGKS